MRPISAFLIIALFNLCMGCTSTKLLRPDLELQREYYPSYGNPDIIIAPYTDLPYLNRALADYPPIRVHTRDAQVFAFEKEKYVFKGGYLYGLSRKAEAGHVYNFYRGRIITGEPDYSKIHLTDIERIEFQEYSSGNTVVLVGGLLVAGVIIYKIAEGLKSGFRFTDHQLK